MQNKDNAMLLVSILTLNEMWKFWKNQLLNCIDEHAPSKTNIIWGQEVPLDYLRVNM